MGVIFSGEGKRIMVDGVFNNFLMGSTNVSQKFTFTTTPYFFLEYCSCHLKKATIEH
jgi:hypothetical protein